jgi:Type IV pilin-like G and H, putative
MSDLLERSLKEGSRKINPKRIMALTAIGAIPLGIGICFIQVPIGCACADPGLSTTGSYLRAQQAYHVEKQSFSKSFESLGIPSIPEKTKRYLFSTEVISDRVYIYATPREVPTDLFGLGLTKAKISALVGAVGYDEKQKETTSVLCIAEGSTFDKPPQPVFNGGKFTCPSGFYAR